MLTRLHDASLGTSQTHNHDLRFPAPGDPQGADLTGFGKVRNGSSMLIQMNQDSGFTWGGRYKPRRC